MMVHSNTCKQDKAFNDIYTKYVDRILASYVRHFYSQDYLVHHLRQFTILHLRHTRESAYADPRISTESAFLEAIGKKSTPAL